MANMRLRCIHSCMVLTVVGLLLIYSAFLTGPSYVDSTLEGGNSSPSGGAGTSGGETTGLPGSQSKLILSQASSLLGDVTGNELVLSAGDGGASRSEPQKPGQTASSVFPDPSPDRLVSSLSGGGGEMSENIATALLGPSKDSSVPASPNNLHDLILQKKKQLLGVRGGRPSNVVWTRDIYESGFSYPNSGVCPNDGMDIRLVILITSAPAHFSARDAIRLTWGHYAQRLDVSMAFIVGKSDNETVLDGIENEKRLYDDLIVSNFVDSYDNLTLKTMATLEWVDTYCNQSEYVLKTDDDMFINVPNLLKFIDRIEPEDKKRPKLYGRLARKWKPVRNKRSKYYISFQQYKKTVYPDFNTGPAYLFSTRIVRPLFEKGMEKTYLKLEDVYTTGILAEELGIKRINIADFANKKVNFHKTGFCALSKLISMHMVAYHEQFELWKKILDGRTKCKIIYTSAAKTAQQKIVAEKQQQQSNSHSESNSQQASANNSNNNNSINNNHSNNLSSNLTSNNSNNNSNNVSSLANSNNNSSATVTAAGDSSQVLAAAAQSSGISQEHAATQQQQNLSQKK